jgi:CAI-1 autoinducer synthase
MPFRTNDPFLAATLPSLRRRVADPFERYPHGHVVHGRATTDTDVILSGSDDVAIGNDRRIVHSQLDALAEPRHSIFISGVYAQYLDRQLRVEKDYVAWLDADAALLSQSGFVGNDGLVQATTGPDPKTGSSQTVGSDRGPATTKN